MDAQPRSRPGRAKAGPRRSSPCRRSVWLDGPVKTCWPLRASPRPHVPAKASNEKAPSRKEPGEGQGTPQGTGQFSSRPAALVHHARRTFDGVISPVPAGSPRLHETACSSARRARQAAMVRDGRRKALMRNFIDPLSREPPRWGRGQIARPPPRPPSRRTPRWSRRRRSWRRLKLTGASPRRRRPPSPRRSRVRCARRAAPRRTGSWPAACVGRDGAQPTPPSPPCAGSGGGAAGGGGKDKKKETQLGLSTTKAEDFSKWYQVGPAAPRCSGPAAPRPPPTAARAPRHAPPCAGAGRGQRADLLLRRQRMLHPAALGVCHVGGGAALV